MATQSYTNGVTLTDATEFNNFDSVAYAVLSGVAGTNTITATGPANYSLSATRPPVWITPANTNTGATTLNITPSGGAALGAKAVFWNGVACVGGEFRLGIPAAVIYDGTQYHIIANGFNAPFNDAHAIVEGSADSTKKVRIEADGITTATTRVITIPDRDLTLNSLSPITNSLTGDVALNNTGNYFDGPSIAQGTAGTWFASGTVTVRDTAGGANINVKLWDGTTVIASAQISLPVNFWGPVSLSGYIASPAANIRISVNDLTSTSGVMGFNTSGNSKDCTVTAIRIA